MTTLRGYQIDIVNKLNEAWSAGHRNVITVLPTGAGKTACVAHVAQEFQGRGIAVAHRGELVCQISTALAREGLQHNIVASQATIRTIVENHMIEFGRTYYNPNARWSVASAQTLVRRDLPHAESYGMGVIDECHHITQGSTWHKVMQKFPNARWMLPTATPERADGKGLGAHHDGVADAMVLGPDMRWMIDNGYLTDYRCRGVMPSDLDMSDVRTSSGGDYNRDDVSRAVKRSNRIVGDVVGTYLTHTPNMLAILFAPDIESAQRFTDAFNAAGVAAALLTGNDTEEHRRHTLRRYASREIKVLCNVDLFGEGFDLPAIEVVIFARPTASYSLYAQMWGRALRLMISKVLMAAWESYTPSQRLDHIARSEKPVAYIHDHVGNLLQFNGPPDKPRKWSLDRKAKRASKANDGIPMRLCTGTPEDPGCQMAYERSEIACPYCGKAPPPPQERSKPEHVDGDLTLYTPEMLREMFGVDTIEQVEKQAEARLNTGFIPIAPGLSDAAIGAAKNRFRERATAQIELRDAMRLVMPANRDERVNNKRFFLEFGVDTLNAKMLSSTEARELRDRIVEKVRG